MYTFSTMEIKFNVTGAQLVSIISEVTGWKAVYKAKSR